MAINSIPITNYFYFYKSMLVKQFLFRPHPFDFSIKRISTHVLIAFLSVFFVLFVVQPFKIDQTNLSDAFYIAISFALVCPFVIFPLEIGLSKLFPNHYCEKNWSVIKTMLHFTLVILFMSLGNYLMSLLLFENTFSLMGIVNFLYPTVAVGIIPITISIFFTQYKYYKKFKIQADQLNLELQEKLNPKSANAARIIENKGLEFTSKENQQINNEEFSVKNRNPENIDAAITFSNINNTESIKIIPEVLIYCSAADNYVDLFFIENQKVKRVTQRNTLGNIYKLLLQFPYFVKCHRSYLINATMVENIFGNAQGLKLKLKNIDEEIPVSRSMHREIPKLILQFAKR